MCGGACMERLKIRREGFELYSGGYPRYPQNFTRDSILSAVLASDAKMLRNQLEFCALRQGVKKNPHSGEEPGKIFHAQPGAQIRGLVSDFNACDSTALFVYGHEVYQQLTGDVTLVERFRKHIERAIAYVRSHLRDNLFVEDPAFCGAKRFALKVTYWKDAEMQDRQDAEPSYPVVYMLAHVQNMRALRSAAKLLDAPELARIADEMAARLQDLFDSESGTFYIAKDALGPIRGISSDTLHALCYLQPGDLSDRQIAQIVESSKALETCAGYRGSNTPGAGYSGADYADLVWVFEQALIHIGAQRFGLKHVQEVSSRVLDYVKDSDTELLLIKGDTVTKKGCDPQLWTIAAKKYFAKAGVAVLSK